MLQGNGYYLYFAKEMHTHLSFMLNKGFMICVYPYI